MIKTDDIKIKEYKRMQNIATSLLVGMMIIFLISKYFEHSSVVARILLAFSEAAMIGAIADWFAVVALFRHPLGMSWLPHTAIIKKSKNKIGEGLSNFVVDNFLEEKVIMDKLSSFDLVHELTIFIENNKNNIAANINNNLIEYVKSDNTNNEFASVLNTEVSKLITNSNFSVIFANIISLLTSSGKHEIIVSEVIKQIYIAVQTNREKIIELIKNNANPIVKMFSSQGVDYLLEFISNLDKNDKNGTKDKFYHFINDYLKNLVINLKGSVETQEKVNKIKNDLITSTVAKEYVYKLAEELKDIIILYSVKKSDRLEGRIIEFIDNIVIKKLKESEAIKIKLNQWLAYTLSENISIYKKEVGSLIAQTIQSWDGDEVSEKIELQVGRDLQYIRINGALIGGIVGLILYGLSALFP